MPAILANIQSCSIFNFSYSGGCISYHIMILSFTSLIMNDVEHFLCVYCFSYIHVCACVSKSLVTCLSSHPFEAFLLIYLFLIMV